MLSLMNHAHPALAELGEDFVVGDGLADHGEMGPLPDRQ